VAIDREWVEFASRAQLREWLSRHHSSSAGIWAVYPKASTGESDISWTALVEECLCFGWIDSRPGKVDERRTRTYICQRKPGSGWSRRNKEIIDRLLADGRMTPVGLRSVEQAKADGSWSLFDAAEAMVIPEVLSTALADQPGARDGFMNYPDRTKKALLQWVYTARRAHTQQQRSQAIAVAASTGNRPKGF
jgi:uncharacterized protein YdeI (YjbR/CyaY-like superfamily)